MNDRLIFRRPGTAINPEPAHWRIDRPPVPAAGIRKPRVVGWVVDTQLHPSWPPRPRSRRWVPYIGAPYPEGQGLDPAGTLDEAADHLVAWWQRRQQNIRQEQTP